MYEGPVVWIWQTQQTNIELRDWAQECQANMLPVLDMLMSHLVQKFQTIEHTPTWLEARIQTSTFFDGLQITDKSTMSRKQALLRQCLDFFNTRHYFGVNKAPHGVYVLDVSADKVKKLISYNPYNEVRGRQNISPHSGRPLPAIMYHPGQKRIPEKAFWANRTLWLHALLDHKPLTRKVQTVASYCRLGSWEEFQQEYGSNNMWPVTYVEKKIRQPIEAYGLFKVQVSGGVCIADKTVTVTCNYNLGGEVQPDENSIDSDK